MTILPIVGFTLGLFSGVFVSVLSSVRQKTATGCAGSLCRVDIFRSGWHRAHRDFVCPNDHPAVLGQIRR